MDFPKIPTIRELGPSLEQLMLIEMRKTNDTLAQISFALNELIARDNARQPK